MINKDIIADIGLLLTAVGVAGAMTILSPIPSGKVTEVTEATEVTWCDIAQSETYLSEQSAEVEHCTEIISAWVDDMSLDYGASDAYLLAKIAYAEARGEDLEGQALVIRVVLNRVWSEEFPDTVADVIFQPGQFAGVASDAWNVMDLPDEAYEALTLVESGWDKSQGATYFCTEAESQWHKEHLRELFVHGGHIFFKEEAE